MNAPFRPSNFFNLDNRMTVVLFAGMGGGCDGLEEAGFHVHLAINHDPIAVAVHQKRHPHTKYLRCDVFEVCPKEATKGRGVRVLHASPDCTHFSVAKGGKPVSKRRRSLAWVVCRWAGTVRPETITLENVKEIQTWGPLIAKRCEKTGRVMKLDKTVAAKGERVPIEQQWLIPDPRHKGRIWKAWLKHMHGLGYSYDGRVLNCADFGIHTIRTRYFGVAQADGSPIVWPERTHAPRKIAKKLGLKPWLGVHEVIDWLLPVKSIFGRAKELADATKRRTARGVMRYVINAARPFIVPITHSGHDRVHSVDEPLRTITTAHRGELSVAVPHFGVMRNSRNPMYGAEDPAHAFTAGGANHALVSATMIQSGYGVRVGQSPRILDIEEPAATQVASGSKAAVIAASLQRQFGESIGADVEEPAPVFTPGGSGKSALVAAFMAQHNDGPRAGDNVRSVDDPASTITTSGSQQGVVAAHMLALRGTNKEGRDARDPAATITAGGNHAGLVLGFLQAYYSGNGGYEQTLDDPLGALTQKARHGLVTVKVKGAEYILTDIGMRMLEPEEGAAAHGFKKGSLPDTITLDGKEVRLTKTQKYHLVGNSVPPKMIRLLAEHNVRREFAEAAE
ncbi:C-5 cytosine-specific DNA methylase [Agrobacterium phage Atu_ph08]|uniref:C-5 cytosine-specific DNA methylase n=1 Tax=Agrobacterium phage Atu_ph08 TaxID=2024265 RepID=A0A223W0A9_9CAUD|nr:C-5 cytosine-specific DNA methylase [Agrobacterium phage Atu_ph08]ASV44769.1 C-5 cytosine-specific DNA methylase [Agrobacterium phage Atu_ph08]